MDGQGFEVIYLNDLPYYCQQEEYQQLATLLGKVSFGDYTKDSDMLISSKIYSSFTGGGQVEQTAREGSDEGRYWFGSLNTMYPSQLGLNDWIQPMEGAGFPLGDLGNSFYAANTDGDLNEVDPSTFTTSTVGQLADPPVYRGYEWNGKQYIPQGSHGYQSHNGSQIDMQNASIQAVCFTEWNNKLFALCANHTLQSSTDGSSWTQEGTFNTSAKPYRLVKYINASEEDALYISTSKGVLAFNHDAQVISTTRLFGPESFPPHPDNGLGMCMWKPGEDLFVTVGLDMLRWNLNAVSTVQSGLNRDEGLPPEYRGAMVDLVPGHRAMYALVRGYSDVTPPSPSGGNEGDPGMIQEGDFAAVRSEARNLVMAWNGFGWHPVAAPADPGDPSWMVMSQAGGAPRLWWGVGGTGYCVKINRSFLNLRSQLAVGEGKFQRNGYLETARFDAGKIMFDKVLSHLELTLSAYDGPGVHQVLLDYRTDRHDWSGLDAAELINIPVGQTLSIPFNVERLADGNDFARGEVCRWVQFRIRMTTNDTSSTPIMDSLTLKYITRPLATSTFSLHLPLIGWRNLPDPRTGKPRGSQAIKEELDALSVSPGFVRLVHNGMSENQRSHRVYLSRLTGSNQVGLDPDGMRIISMVQVPLSIYEGNQEVPGHG